MKTGPLITIACLLACLSPSASASDSDSKVDRRLPLPARPAVFEPTMFFAHSLSHVQAANTPTTAEFFSVRQYDLEVNFQDNSRSPKVLSGLQSLFNTRSAPEYDAFDPDIPGASAGLNFEHIIAGHANPANRFSPRLVPARLRNEGDRNSGPYSLTWKAEENPWRADCFLKYEVVEPHYIDFEFRCTPRDASRFGKRRHAIFFFANYMNEVRDVAIHFPGVAGEGVGVDWIVADAPPGEHADYNGGGTYRAVAAGPVEYDDDHDFKLNSWSYAGPRIAEPFYFGRARHDMTMILMFDRLHTPRDEIRFSLFKFKVNENSKRPAWDFQYVVHDVEEDQQYGFRGRLVWKKFVDRKDCRAEYTRWRQQLDEADKP